MGIRNVLAGVAASLSVGLAAGAQAAPTVLNFDDLPVSGNVPDGYGGITWNNLWAYFAMPYSPYTAHSGATRIFAHVSYSPILFSSDVLFDGAYFSGYAPIGPVNFDLFYNGALVHHSDALILSDVPTYLSAGYSGLVDEVRVVGAGGYYVMDDFTFAAARSEAVPEPATWALMIGGLGLAGAALRRRRTVMA